jgi:hypothetical protein
MHGVIFDGGTFPIKRAKLQRLNTWLLLLRMIHIQQQRAEHDIMPGS